MDPISFYHMAVENSTLFSTHSPITIVVKEGEREGPRKVGEGGRYKRMEGGRDGSEGARGWWTGRE